MPGGISGPVASGPTAGQSMSPFAVADDTGPPPGDSENRSRSWRIYLLLLVLFGMVISVAVIVVIAVVIGMQQADDADASDNGSTTTTTVPSPSPSPAPRGGGDTAAPPEPIEQYVPPSRPSSRPRPSSGSTAPSSAPAPAPRPAPAAASGTVTVSVPADQRFQAVEITCDNGFRQRGAFNGQVARVEDVPNSSCTLLFKGGAPATFRPVSGGRSYSCEFPAPGTAACR